MKLLIAFTIISVVTFFSSCRTVQRIDTFENLREVPNAIQIVCTDSTVYYLDKFSVTDSSIIGQGSVEREPADSVFNGELLFKNIVYVQRRETSFLGSLLLAGAAVYVIADGFNISRRGAGIDPNVKIVYPYSGGTGSSCPYIYSWSGSGYKLEGEAFGVALGSQLEMETCTVLSELKNKNDRLNVKITNERPETHFFNRIKLLCAAVEPDAEMICDNRNQLWSVKDKLHFTGASDNTGKDITCELYNKDDVYWKSDLSSASMDGNYEDKIFVEFQSDKKDSAAIIVSAINTEISNLVFQYLQKVLGDDYVNFMNAVETDTEIMNILRQTLVRCSLKIDVWDGDQWKYAAMIYPEANSVPFSKLVRVPVFPDGTLKVRFRCMTDLWRIDEVCVSSNLQHLDAKSIEILSSKKGDSAVNKELAAVDGSYCKLIPGEVIDLTAKSPAEVKGKKNQYAVIVDGYLYEWLIDKSSTSLLSKVDGNTEKVRIAKNLMRNMDLLLPVIYSEWKIQRR